MVIKFYPTVERPAICKQDSKFSQQSLDESENVQYRPPGIIDSAQALGGFNPFCSYLLPNTD